MVNIGHQHASNEKFEYVNICLGDSEGRTAQMALHGKKAAASAILREFDVVFLSNFQMRSAKKLDLLCEYTFGVYDFFDKCFEKKNDLNL